MKPKDVLVIGAGIAGCAVALAIAKKDVPVTILTSSFDQRSYHASFIKLDNLEEKLKNLQQVCRQMGCSRATEQLMNLARKSIEELLGSHFLIDRNGNVDIHRGLQEQLKQMPNVEWINHHSAIELLTLQNHSTRRADIYKTSTCLGVYAYNHETHHIETILAKETILATGSAVSLYPYSTHTSTAKGTGIAMAQRAGARLLNMDQIQFHPLALFTKDKPCVPLPIELLKGGGKLYTANNIAIEGLSLDVDLSKQLYEELINNRLEHLWLDLTILDSVALKDRYPFVDSWCLNYGFNIAKDLIPVVPVAQYTCGGVVVDRVGQTTVQRLRAVGEVSCTGLFYDFREEAVGVLEGLTWAVACAEDIVKQLSKFIYYFPELREWNYEIDTSSPLLKEDWYLLRQIMWYYVGIIRDEQRLRRGYALLQRLKAESEVEERGFSIDRMRLKNALEAALLITRSALEQHKSQHVLGQDPLSNYAAALS